MSKMQQQPAFEVVLTGSFQFDISKDLLVISTARVRKTEARRIQGLWWVPQTTPAGVSARIMTVHRVHTSVGVPAHHGREIHSYLSLLHIPSLGFSFPVSPRGRSSYMVLIFSH